MENLQSKPIIDKNAWNSFHTLMGNKTTSILLGHFEIATRYVNSINESLNTKNFISISQNAHPLKSSSQQIGALRVASIAKEIEKLANFKPSDIGKLKELAKELEKTHHQTIKEFTELPENK